MKEWLLARLSEKSTWGGIATFAAAMLGSAIRPDLWSEITTAGMAIASALLIVTREQKQRDRQP
jgi:hypothetical protein